MFVNVYIFFTPGHFEEIQTGRLYTLIDDMAYITYAAIRQRTGRRKN